MIPKGKPTRFYSSKQEKTVAKSLGGRQVSNSGATAFNKGDVLAGSFLIECKTVTKEQKTFTIKKDWIEKNQEEAFAMGKQYSAIAIDFGDGIQHYVISEALFSKLKDFLENS